jgi:hypothetical protein
VTVGDGSNPVQSISPSPTVRQFSDQIRGAHIQTGGTYTVTSYNSIRNGGAPANTNSMALAFAEGTGLPAVTGSTTPTRTAESGANVPVWAPCTVHPNPNIQK